MAKRFIKLYEQITNWEWFRHPNTLCLFIYLLLKANFRDLSFQGRTIHRGQLVTSLPKISTDTGLSIQQTRTALLHLISTGEVTDESNPHYRIITVVKYDEYQTATDRSTDNQQTTNRQINRQSTDNLTSSIEYIEQYRTNRKIEGIDNISPPAKGASQDFDFDVFWAAYPRHSDKQAARKAFDKIHPDENLMQKMIAAINAWKESDQWKEDGGRYIPYPSSWLNKKRWEDEVPAKRQNEPMKPAKQVIAQQYEQRSYANVDDELSAELAREMEEYMRRENNGR